MTTSPRVSLPEDPLLLLHAYLDGELDPINALEIERRLATDPALAAERDRVETLRRLLRERMPREAPSPALQARIERAAGLRAVPPRPSWRALAASVAVTAMLASSATWFASNIGRDAVTDAVVSAHIRGLMATQPVDVASSERHTVKPWFSGRIAEAPRVVDLGGAGFVLVGARVDVISREPAPSVIYRRRQHVISVTALSGSDATLTMNSADRLDGYNIVKWTDNKLVFVAVSDLNNAELQEFAKLFRAAE
jgi:anti-sigma factor RsiW